MKEKLEALVKELEEIENPSKAALVIIYNLKTALKYVEKL